MFSLHKIRLTISRTTTVTTWSIWVSPKMFQTQILNWLIKETLFKTHALLNDDLDKVLCRMHKSLIFLTFCKVLFFGKESFINAKTIKFHTRSSKWKESNKVPNGVPQCLYLDIINTTLKFNSIFKIHHHKINANYL